MGPRRPVFLFRPDVGFLLPDGDLRTGADGQFPLHGTERAAGHTDASAQGNPDPGVVQRGGSPADCLHCGGYREPDHGQQDFRDCLVAVESADDGGIHLLQLLADPGAVYGRGYSDHPQCEVH